MSFWEVILIGLAMAMDASALTIANCTTYRGKLNRLKEWAMPATFAAFQILMPIIGFYIGSTFAHFLTGTDYLVAGVFFVLAAKIVIDIISEKKKGDKEEKDQKSSGFSVWLLILQGLATSIDALIIGVTLSVSVSSPFVPALIIGGVTFLVATVALIFGKSLGKLFGNYAQWVGAFILLVLAVKSFIEALI